VHPSPAIPGMLLPVPASMAWSLFVPAYAPSVLGFRLIDSICLSINTFYRNHGLLSVNLMDNSQACTSNLPSFITGFGNCFAFCAPTRDSFTKP
jgi:hypothetical protein